MITCKVWKLHLIENIFSISSCLLMIVKFPIRWDTAKYTIGQLYILQEVAQPPVTALVDVTVEDNITALTDTVDVPIFKRIPI